jgi:hypothetical protein
MVLCKEVVAQPTSRECRRVISCFIIIGVNYLTGGRKVLKRYYLLSGDLIYLALSLKDVND